MIKETVSGLMEKARDDAWRAHRSFQLAAELWDEGECPEDQIEAILFLNAHGRKMLHRAIRSIPGRAEIIVEQQEDEL